MGWWITLGILFLLAILPLGVSAKYDEDGALVRLIVGPVKITLFPRPKKEKKPKKELPKEEVKKEEPPKPAPPVKTETKPASAEPAKTEQSASGPAKQETPAQPVPEGKETKKGGSLTDFLPLVRITLDFLGDFKRKLRVNVLELKLVMATDDPYDLAVNYGRAWAAVGNLLPRLERFLVIKKRDIKVECDFTAVETTVTARLDLTITLGRLLAAVIVFAFRALVEFLKIMNKRKGGTENEPKSSQHAE